MKLAGILQSEIKRGFVYKLDKFLSMFYPAVRFIVQYSLWTSIYSLKDGQNIFGYSKASMISYFLVGYIVTVIVKSDAISLGSEIKDGTIDRDLIKPIHYMYYRLSRNFGAILVPLISALPFLVIAYLAIGDEIAINTSPIILLFFLLSLLIGFIINFFIDFIIGMSAFVLDEVWALNSSVNHIKRFISGEFIPLSILPFFAFKILSYSPFQYVIYFPSVLLTQTPSFDEVIRNLVLGCVWIAVLYLVSDRGWKSLIRRFSAFGG